MGEGGGGGEGRIWLVDNDATYKTSTHCDPSIVGRLVGVLIQLSVDRRVALGFDVVH